MGRYDKAEEMMRMLHEDTLAPRSVREKVAAMLDLLSRNDMDDQRKGATIQSDLEDMAGDVNIPGEVRMVFYKIMSEIEAAMND